VLFTQLDPLDVANLVHQLLELFPFFESHGSA
jgi:hypothetical protein